MFKLDSLVVSVEQDPLSGLSLITSLTSILSEVHDDQLPALVKIALHSLIACRNKHKIFRAFILSLYACQCPYLFILNRSMCGSRLHHSTCNKRRDTNHL